MLDVLTIEFYLLSKPVTPNFLVAAQAIIYRSDICCNANVAQM